MTRLELYDLVVCLITLVVLVAATYGIIMRPIQARNAMPPNSASPMTSASCSVGRGLRARRRSR